MELMSRFTDDHAWHPHLNLPPSKGEEKTIRPGAFGLNRKTCSYETAIVDRSGLFR
jgi:hypothetical protein